MNYLQISARAQRFMLLWGFVMMVILGFAYYYLIQLLPLNPATDSAEEVAAFYRENSYEIRVGAVICSWVSAFAVPIYTVMTAQCSRLEKGVPIWSILIFGGGLMMTIFLVVPPIMWGVAAYSADRMPELTLLMHEFANLTLVTTDQYFIFNMVGVAYIGLSRRDHPLNPFPRWYSYFTIWAALMFELGAFGFMPRTGPFAWDGLFVYWFPLLIFGLWITLTVIVLMRAVTHQEKLSLTDE